MQSSSEDREADMATPASPSGTTKRAASQKPDDRASKKAREDVASNHAIAYPESDATTNETRDQPSAVNETTPAGDEQAASAESLNAPIDINEVATKQQKEEMRMHLSNDGEAFVSYG